MSRVRVYLATSLDGFIAGPDDDLSWLPGPEDAPEDPPPTDALGFVDFLGECGAMLMGRRTFDVVRGFGGDWPYGEMPVLVATHRELGEAPSSVRGVSGDIASLVAAARAAAGDRDVYLDGGGLTRQALAADLIDELILTQVPVLLGGGTRLFDALPERRQLRFTAHHDLAPGMVQLRAAVVRG